MPRSFYIGGTMSLLDDILAHNREYVEDQNTGCLLYTSDAADDLLTV